MTHNCENKCTCDPKWADKLYDELTPKQRNQVTHFINDILGTPPSDKLKNKLYKEANDTKKLLNSTHYLAPKWMVILKRYEQLEDLKKNMDALNHKLLIGLMNMDPITYEERRKIVKDTEELIKLRNRQD